jgi:serine/threonine protein kinase
VFFAERAAGKMNHPYIASLYDAKEGGQRYMVMEYVQGDASGACDRWPAPETRPRGRHQADARSRSTSTRAACCTGHRRPTSCRRPTAPQDFGIAAESKEDAAEHQSKVEGSPMFMSPEQVRGLPLSPASDLYSMGADVHPADRPADVRRQQPQGAVLLVTSCQPHP